MAQPAQQRAFVPPSCLFGVRQSRYDFRLDEQDWEKVCWGRVAKGDARLHSHQFSRSAKWAEVLRRATRPDGGGWRHDFDPKDMTAGRLEALARLIDQEFFQGSFHRTVIRRSGRPVRYRAASLSQWRTITGGLVPPQEDAVASRPLILKWRSGVGAGAKCLAGLAGAAAQRSDGDGASGTGIHSSDSGCGGAAGPTADASSRAFLLRRRAGLQPILHLVGPPQWDSVLARGRGGAAACESAAAGCAGGDCGGCGGNGSTAAAACAGGAGSWPAAAAPAVASRAATLRRRSGLPPPLVLVRPPLWDALLARDDGSGDAGASDGAAGYSGSQGDSGASGHAGRPGSGAAQHAVGKACEQSEQRTQGHQSGRGMREGGRGVRREASGERIFAAGGAAAGATRGEGRGPAAGRIRRRIGGLWSWLRARTWSRRGGSSGQGCGCGSVGGGERGLQAGAAKAFKGGPSATYTHGPGQVTFWREVWGSESPSPARPLRIDGVPCTSRLSWLAHTMGHEMLHVMLFNMCGAFTVNAPNNALLAGHGYNFLVLNWYLLGHRGHTYEAGNWGLPRPVPCTL